MNNLQIPVHDRLIIFGRYPVPGQTKTRLIPDLGPAGAADLQRRFTEKTLITVRKFAALHNISVEFCYDGASERKMRRWFPGSYMIFSKQEPGDIGERMHATFLKAFQEGCRRVVLLGTDIPDLRSDYLEQTFHALTDYDLVLGPSTDGGYWLMGLNRPVDLFQGIKWGTDTVFDQTVVLAKGQGLESHRIEPLTDIDTIDDLKRLQSDWTGPKPYISIIIPALNEGPNIEEVIHWAWEKDVEIIVVDGGSTDDTVKRATDAGARTEVSSRGRALQQNRGAASAQGSVFLFLHADTRLPRGYVHHIFEILIDPKTALGAFRFKTDLDHPLLRAVEFLTNMRSHFLKLPYGDQGLFLRKSLFESIGGFPEVAIAEDLFLVRLLSKHGRIRIAPAYAITSGRRWRATGLLRTTLINQVIMAGCYLGVSPRVLASLYQVS